MALINETISAVTDNQQHSGCLHCRKLVEKFWKTDCLQEKAVEQLVIKLNRSDDDADADGDSDDDIDSHYHLVIE